MEKDTIMQESYHISEDKDNKKCPFCTEYCGYEWCPYNEEEEEVSEEYDKLKTSDRQKLFKVFRQSKFYNFVQFLNHVEELYGKSYKRAIREDFKKVQKCYDESGKRRSDNTK